jgi:threonine synthase
MRFVSTVGKSESVSLADALRRGLASDGGLYLPESLPPLPYAFFERLPGLKLVEIASAVLGHLLAGDLKPEEIRSIAAAAFNFSIPLVALNERVRFLELFHGPTLAFKDVGARCLARLLAATRQDEGTLTVLAATSGDTGGAVAQAFLGVSGTQVVILYPHGLVSPLQERQFTTLGKNVRAFAVEGTFDDCQALVKRAFTDHELSTRLGLTSANSINVGRLLPQIVYYFQAAAQLWSQGPAPILFSTPSGNFGSLAAGLMARALGLEARFVAATNANDVVPCYLKTGEFLPRPSQRTVSNAMDVGNPSNFARIESLYGGDAGRLRRHLRGRAYSDEATLGAIRRVAHKQGYVMDPHTAVGFLALADTLAEESSETVGIVLSTAHPAKFLEVVEPEIGRPLELPPELAEHLGKPILSERIPNDYDTFCARMLTPS